MRSRNGNHSRLLAVCSIIFFHSLTLCASEYLISYRYVVKNMMLFNDSLFISKAMQHCQGEEYKSIELLSNDSRELNTIIKNNSQEFSEFIESLGLHVEHHEITLNAQNTSTTVLTLRTTCFKVDFNDNFAKITALK
jgi:hypothetical protein